MKRRPNEYIRISYRKIDFTSRLHIGTKYFIVVEEFNAIKEICNREEFLDRPDHYFRVSDKHNNLVQLGGEEWKIQRKFQVSTFKLLGMAKQTTHHYVLNEIQDVISRLTAQSNDDSIDLQELLNSTFDNIIYYILYGKNFEPDHPYMHHTAEFFKALSTIYRWQEDSYFKPWLRPLLLLHPRKRAYEKKIDIVAEILRKEVTEHRRNLVPDNPVDFIDYFLTEMMSRQNPASQGFTDEDLVGNMIMLLGAGSITTKLTLTWYLMTLAKYPDVQEKCYNEIVENLGPDRDPEKGDDKSMPYLCASIAESQRVNPISYLNLLRQCNSEGMKLAGFDVPKGTIILQNLWAVNNRKDLWKDPENFRPERFLYDRGQTFAAPDHLTPFSYGKRQCPGMQFANTELFLFAACLIRKFRFLPPDGGVQMDSILYFNATPLKPFVRVRVRT